MSLWIAFQLKYAAEKTLPVERHKSKLQMPRMNPPGPYNFAEWLFRRARFPAFHFFKIRPNHVSLFYLLFADDYMTRSSIGIWRVLLPVYSHACLLRSMAGQLTADCVSDLVGCLFHFGAKFRYNVIGKSYRRS